MKAGFINFAPCSASSSSIREPQSAIFHLWALACWENHSPASALCPILFHPSILIESKWLLRGRFQWETWWCYAFIVGVCLSSRLHGSWLFYKHFSAVNNALYLWVRLLESSRQSFTNGFLVWPSNAWFESAIHTFQPLYNILDTVNLRHQTCIHQKFIHQRKLFRHFLQLLYKWCYKVKHCLEIQQSKELKAQVASLTSQVGSLTADVESLTNEVETLKSDKSVLQKEVQRSSHECRINQGWWHENKVLYWAYNLYPLAALLLLALLLWGSNPINKNTMSLSSVIPL